MMKKILLFASACLISLAGIAQERVLRVDNEAIKSIKSTVVKTAVLKAEDGTKTPNLPVNTSVSTRGPVLAEGEFEVGMTLYDLQSNSALANRFYRFQDGTIGATWTGGVEEPAFPNRGSFYNYWTGTQWQIAPEDVGRIEDARQGWPSYGPWGENGEAIASHPANGVSIWARETKGEGDWNMITQTVNNPEATWPRYCFSDQGSMHLLECLQNDQIPGEVYYSRSKDLGQSWEPQGVILPEIGSEYYYLPCAFRADDYIFAQPRNGVVAFLLSSPTADMVLMKSTDDGETWEKTVIWQHPIEKFDWATMGYTDTCSAPNGAASLAIDDNGMVHVVFAVNATIFEEGGNGSYSYFPYWGSAFYWNEDMDTFTGHDNQYRVLDPVYNQDLYEDDRLLMAYGFDFDGDGTPFSGADNVSGYRTHGPVTDVNIAYAGPERMIFAMVINDERRTTQGEDGETYMVRQIFAGSYKYDQASLAWAFDDQWISAEDGNVASENPDADYSGWVSVNSSYLHQLDDCIYPQVLCQPGSDEGNFYIFFQYDAIPGLAMDTNSPEQTSYTENKVAMWYSSKDFTEANFPEINVEDVNVVESSLVVYPNPTTDGNVTIVVDNNVNCVVYNITGQTVAEYELNEGVNNVSVNGLSAGVYFITAGNQTQKLVVK